MPFPCRAVSLPHRVNQMGKTDSKPLAARHGTARHGTARHGRGTAWARHGKGMLCVNRPLGHHGGPNIKPALLNSNIPTRLHTPFRGHITLISYLLYYTNFYTTIIFNSPTTVIILNVNSTLKSLNNICQAQLFYCM